MKRVIETIVEKETKKSKVPFIVAGVVVAIGVTALAIKRKIDFEKELENPVLVMSKLKDMHFIIMDSIQEHIESVNEGEKYGINEKLDKMIIVNMAKSFNRYLIKVGDRIAPATNKYDLLPTDYDSLQELFLSSLPAGGTENEE